MEQKRFNYSLILLLSGIAFFLVLEYRLTLLASYVPDEFQHTAWAGDLYAGMPAYAPEMPGKTRLSMVLFRLAYHLGDRIELVLFINRHVMLALVVFSLLVLYGIHRQLFGSMRGALWAVLWTLLCTTFIERSFRIRTDLIATFLSLLAVYSFLAFRSWRRVVAAGIWLSLAFCTTQKSAYFIVAFIIAYWVAGRKTFTEPVRAFLFFAAAGLLVFVAYVLVFARGGDYLHVLRVTFLDEDMMKNALGRYFRARHHYYVQTFFRNIAFYSLALSGLALLLFRWRETRPRERFFHIYSAVMLILILLHREPWPYVFVMVIPLLGVYAGWLSDRIQDQLETSPRLVRLPALLLLFMTVAQAVGRHRTHLSVTNETQLRTLRAAEAVLGPDDTYFDGVRMIGTRRPASRMFLFWPVVARLVENWETEGVDLMKQLLRSRCKVVIYTNNRIAGLPEGFHHFLQSHYLLIDQNVFVAGARVTSPPGQIVLLWSGPYGLIAQGECRNITVDGTDVDPKATLKLRAGKHTVAFEGTGMVQILPLRAKLWVLNNKTSPRLEDLFWKQYSL